MGEDRMSQLHEHRIERIEVLRLQSHYPRLIGKNARLDVHGTGAPCRIAVVHTDRGATGWGVLCGPRDGDTSTLVGRRISDLFDPDSGVIDDRALPLDFALHDLAGVILAQPVHRMLGSQGSTEVPCYDGAIYMDDLDPAEAPQGIEIVLANCASDYELGHRAFKLKIGRGNKWMERDQGVRRDIEITRAVRESYPDCGILVDANDGYTPDTLIEYLDGVSGCDLFWIEEPFREDRDDLKRFRAYLQRHSPQTLIADGEFEPDVGFVLELAREGLLDVLIMDVVSFGLTAWRRLMPTLRDIGVRASPHAWGQPLKTMYTAQIAAGLGNVVTVEGVPGTTDGVSYENYSLKSGKLHLPEAPGFGLRLSCDSIANGG